MIHNFDLIENPNARTLAYAISRLPNVLTVRWFPPFKPDSVREGGEGALMFHVILNTVDGVTFPQWNQLLSRTAWDNPANIDSIVAVIEENLANAV